MSPQRLKLYHAWLKTVKRFRRYCPDKIGHTDRQKQWFQHTPPLLGPGSGGGVFDAWPVCDHWSNNSHTHTHTYTHTHIHTHAHTHTHIHTHTQACTHTHTHTNTHTHTHTRSQSERERERMQVSSPWSLNSNWTCNSASACGRLGQRGKRVENPQLAAIWLCASASSIFVVFAREPHCQLSVRLVSTQLSH